MARLPRLRHFLEQLLHTHDTPRRTAAAYALGVFFGFSPFLGLHTILGIALAFALNLNRVAVVVGVYSNLPWILPAYYTLATVLGAAILGANVPPGLMEDLSKVVSDVSWDAFREMGRTLTPLLWSFTLGSTIGALGLAAVAYRLSLAMILTHRRHQAHHRSQTTEL